MSLAFENLAYLVASVLFVLGIKGLTHPRTARRGNRLSALGMLVAVVATLLAQQYSVWTVLAGLFVGSAIGAWLALRVRMTQMPEMVALLNGFGGAASIFVAWVEAISIAALVHLAPKVSAVSATLVDPGVEVPTAGPSVDPLVYQKLIAISLSGLIGTVTLFGSLVAYGKLAELQAFKRDIRLPSHQLLNGVLVLVALMLGAMVVVFPTAAGWWYFGLVIVASILGVSLVVRIGGADMPVVIALLNSYSGLAAAATGFVINNNVLIIAGSLVGASGIILTSIMCRAMNRSLTNVLFGGIDASSAGGKEREDEIYAGKVKSTSAEEIGILLADASRVVIVPGYGMAVAQAQFATRDLYQLLEERGVNVEFAIHPVAGRMPGHMNVLLAEVDIPYEKLREMDQINPEFEQIDVAIVIGANDVVNPDARENPSSPIAGMPILNVDKARTVIVIKRSLSPGFAGIPNPLFAADNTLMFFADAKQAVLDIVTATRDA